MLKKAIIVVLTLIGVVTVSGYASKKLGLLDD